MEMIVGMVSGFISQEWVMWMTAAVTCAAAIAAVTPTPKDDAWVAKIYKIVDMIALNVGKAKDKPEDK